MLVANIGCFKLSPWLIANHEPCRDPIRCSAGNHTANYRIQSRVVPSMLCYGQHGSRAGFSPILCQFLHHHCLEIVCINVRYCGIRGPGWRSRYNCLLPTGQSGDRIPVWARFSHPSIPALGPIQFPGQWVPGFPGVRRPGLAFGRPPPSSFEVKERRALGLYLYSPSGPSWHVQG